MYYIRCKKCKVDKHENNYQFIERGAYLVLNSRTCRSCTTNNARIVKELKKLHTKPANGLCQCCGIYSDRLHLDHCHTTGNFRGWLCESCNTGLGKLGDTIDGVLRALKYLLKIQFVGVTKRQRNKFLSLSKFF